MTAFLWTADSRRILVTIRNLSPDGFMGETSELIQEDTRIGVELPDIGIIQARVRWCEYDEVGCQFIEPLDLDSLIPPLC